jgi:hypothetical protein
MALAATEKAKVWTSVRIRYLNVERKIFGEERNDRRRDREDGRSLGVGGGVGGVDMEIDFIVSETGEAAWNAHKGCRAGYGLFLYLS